MIGSDELQKQLKIQDVKTEDLKRIFLVLVCASEKNLFKYDYGCGHVVIKTMYDTGTVHSNNFIQVCNDNPFFTLKTIFQNGSSAEVDSIRDIWS